MLVNTYYIVIFAAMFILIYAAINRYRLHCGMKLLREKIQPHQHLKSDVSADNKTYSAIFSQEKSNFSKWIEDTKHLINNRYNYYVSTITTISISCLYFYYQNVIAIYALIPLLFLVNFLTLRIYCEKKRKQIIRDLPESLNFIHRSLRAGLTLQQALISLPNNCPSSLKGIFQNIADKIKLGQGVDSAIWNATKHLNIKELNYFMLLSKIQQEVGGNFSETVNTLSDMLKSKNMLNMKLRALTAEARSSSTLLGSLPFIMGVIISYINPEYINVFFYDTRGNYMLAASVLLLLTGITVMLKLAKIDP